MSSNTDSSMKLKDTFFFSVFNNDIFIEKMGRKKEKRPPEMLMIVNSKNLIVGIMRNRQVLLSKEESSETMTLNYACKAEL